MKNTQGLNVTRHTTFKKLTIATILATSLCNSAVYAEELTAEQKHAQAQTNEEIGFGSGLVLGAIFGGPVGAIVTSIAGNFIAKNINATDDIEQLEHTLAMQSLKQKQELAAYRKKLHRSEQSFEAELLALEQSYQQTSKLQAENLMMSLQFSTGSSDIKPHYNEQIKSLAALLNQAPTLHIDLSGYTDLQGSSIQNQALSLARVKAVKSALVKEGVNDNRIKLYAFGEQAPVVANNQQEISFYDRRVVIQLNDSTNTHDQTAGNY